MSDIYSEIATRLGGRLLGHAPLGGGVSSRVERVDLVLRDGAPRPVVLRHPGAAGVKATDAEGARREFALLRWLHDRGVPVPRPLLGEAGWLVMEHVDGGREMAVPAGLVRMAEVLAEVHGLLLDGAPGLPEREDPIAGLLDLLPPESALRARLDRSPPRLTPRRTLLHGDYWPGNLLWRGPALVAVIDWEDAAVGDPLSDVACCRLELRYLHGVAGAETFTAAYARAAGADLSELAAWDAYVAAAALTYMGRWGLEPAREAHMRREAGASLAEASRALGA